MEKEYYTIRELVEMGVGSRYELYNATQVAGQTYAFRNGGDRSTWRFHLEKYLQHLQEQQSAQ